MKGIGSDVIALAAVLGSAAVAGVVTLALASSDSGEVAYECVVTEVETAPRVVVALNDGHAAVVVAPHVRASSAEVCAEVVVDRLDGDAVHLERARFRIDRAHESIERSRHELRERLEGLERLQGLQRLQGLEQLKQLKQLERLDRVERVRRTRALGDEIEHEIETTRVMVDGVTIELEGLGELLDLELEGLSEALELQFRGRANVDGEMERIDLEMRAIDNDLKEELKRIIDELRRKRRKGGR